LGVDFSVHEAVAFQFAKLPGEHFRGDGGEEAAELGKAAEARIEVVEDEDLPFAADEDQRAFRGTSGYGTLGFGSPHHWRQMIYI
jgi:hypothetical protein